MRLELKRFTLESTLVSIVPIERSLAVVTTLAVVMTLAFTHLAAFALDVSFVRQVWETHPAVEAVSESAVRM